jgi:hypothetical protein
LRRAADPNEALAELHLRESAQFHVAPPKDSLQTRLVSPLFQIIEDDSEPRFREVREVQKWDLVAQVVVGREPGEAIPSHDGPVSL